MLKTTLITACYNNEKTIADTLKSVSEQTHNNIEHIIIDGASTDNTLKIIDRYKQPFTKVVSEPDNGMYDAINKGIKLATGDIIGLLHSDDELFDKNTLEKIANSFQKEKCDLLFANGIFVNNNNKIIRNWITKEYKPAKLYFGWVPLHTTMYFTKNTIQKTGFYNTKYKIASDYEYTLRVFKRDDIKTFYLNAYVMRMKMGGKSTSIKNQFAKSKEDFLIMQRYNLPSFFTLTFKILRKTLQFF